MRHHNNKISWNTTLYFKLIYIYKHEVQLSHKVPKKHKSHTHIYIYIYIYIYMSVCVCVYVCVCVCVCVRGDLLGKWEFVCFVFRGESPGCRLFGTASMLEWLRNLLPHHSQGSSTERWSRNTLRVVNARVFYVLGGFNVPLYFK